MIERLVYTMKKSYELMCKEKRTSRSEGALLRVTGDRSIPLMDALLELSQTQPEVLAGLVEVVPLDGEPLGFSELRQFRSPYLKALNDISRSLQDNGYEAASKFLNSSLEL